MNNTALLVNTGDQSNKIWKYWYKYYIQNWSCSGFIDTVFLSEEMKLDDVLCRKTEIISTTTGKIDWASGLINYLLKCHYQYIILVHEDYFLTESTWANIAKYLIDFVQKHDIKLLKCCGWWAGYIDENAPMVEDESLPLFVGEKVKKVIWRYNNESQYLISHQTSIWSKDFLLSTLKAGESPWEHEIIGTLRLRERNIPIYAYRDKCPFEYGETVQQNKVRPGCGHYFDGEFNDGDSIL